MGQRMTVEETKSCLPHSQSSVPARAVTAACSRAKASSATASSIALRRARTIARRRPASACTRDASKESLRPVATNTLQDIHRQAEAEFQPYGDVEIVSTFGEPPAEYAAVRKGCGMMDLPQRGVLELSGKDRLPFLNNLLSNQTYGKESKTGLAAGKGVYAFLLSAKSGRVVTDVNVIERGERTLLELYVRRSAMVKQTLDRYRFAEQVKLADRRNELHESALHGPRAAEGLKSVGVEGIDALESLDSMAASLFEVETSIW